MGDKITAKATVAAFGVPVVPGVAARGLSDAELIDAAAGIGYPVLVKPSAGGGGKGMRVVERARGPRPRPSPAPAARRRRPSATTPCSSSSSCVRPRHIEVQVLADGHGNVVHLGERECCLQRRHQKVVEEAPSPLLDAATRARIGAAACDTARSVDYAGAGTVEFIVSAAATGRLLLHGDEHPPAGRAPGHRAGHRPRPGRVAAPGRGGRAAAVRPGRHPAHRPRRRGPRLRRGPRPWVPAHRRPRPRAARAGRPRRPGGLGPANGHRRRLRLRPHARPRSSPTRPPGRRRSAASTGRWPRPACSACRPTSPSCAVCWPTPTFARGRLDTSLLDRIAAEYTPADAPDAAFLAAAARVWLARWQDADPGDLWSTAGRLAGRRPRARPGSGSPAATGRPRSPSPVRPTAPARPSTTAQPPPGMRAGRRRDRADDRRPATRLPGREPPPRWSGCTSTARPTRYGRAPEERRRADAGQDASAVITSPMPGSVVAVHVEDGQSAERGAPVARGRGDEDGARAQGARSTASSRSWSRWATRSTSTSRWPGSRAPTTDENATEGEPA